MKKLNPRSAQGGLTLVELMVALVLGLVLLGGFLHVFINSQQAFRTNEGLARIQENARVGSELLLRDIRAAGGNACGTKLVGNVLQNASTHWWADWAAGPLRGVDGNQAFAGVTTGTGASHRVEGTSLIVALSTVTQEGLTVVDPSPGGVSSIGNPDSRSVLTASNSGNDPSSTANAALLRLARTISMNPRFAFRDIKEPADSCAGGDGSSNSAQFKVNEANHGLENNDVVMVCDHASAAIFQVTNANQANRTIVHNTGGGSGSIGNCSKGLGYPSICTTNGKAKAFGSGSVIAKLSGVFWYVGHNGRGSRSLYRRSYENPVAQEIVEGIHDMQIEYLRADTEKDNELDTSWKTAAEVGASGWSESAPRRVVAVRITLTARSNEAVGAGAQALQRKFFHVVRLRNREVL